MPSYAMGYKKTSVPLVNSHFSVPGTPSFRYQAAGGAAGASSTLNSGYKSKQKQSYGQYHAPARGRTNKYSGIKPGAKMREGARKSGRTY